MELELCCIESALDVQLLITTISAFKELIWNARVALIFQFFPLSVYITYWVNENCRISPLFLEQKILTLKDLPVQSINHGIYLFCQHEGITTLAILLGNQAETPILDDTALSKKTFLSSDFFCLVFFFYIISSLFLLNAKRTFNMSSRNRNLFNLTVLV